MLNTGILSGVQDLLDQLIDITVALNRCQNDTTSTADAIKAFHILFHNPILEPHKSKLLRRFQQVITPAHQAAYLHPQYQESILLPYSWWCKKVNNLKEWRINENCYSIRGIFCTVSLLLPTITVAPICWWKGVVQPAGLSSDFLQMITQLCTACASSSSIERVIGSIEIVQSHLCNRPGNDKAEKLVFCCRMLRGAADIGYLPEEDSPEWFWSWQMGHNSSRWK